VDLARRSRLILSDYSYNFLYRSEPNEEPHSKEWGFHLALRLESNQRQHAQSAGVVAGSVIQFHAQVLAPSMGLRCAIIQSRSQSILDEVRTVNSVLTFYIGRPGLKLERGEYESTMLPDSVCKHMG